MAEEKLEYSDGIEDNRNDILQRMQTIQNQIHQYKDSAREFYFGVLYSIYKCPVCGGTLGYSGPSQAKCSCGAEIDPTIEFQKSSCCEASLVKKVFHYACRRCGKLAQSMFLFEERVFDNLYFKEMMRESCERKKKKREELRLLLANTRSEPVEFDCSINSENLMDLSKDLDEFICEIQPIATEWESDRIVFNMEKYQAALWETIQAGDVWFSAFSPLCGDDRKDRAFRFVTLIYMCHDRLVDLEQHGNDILVIKHEAHAEG